MLYLYNDPSLVSSRQFNTPAPGQVGELSLEEYGGRRIELLDGLADGQQLALGDGDVEDPVLPDPEDGRRVADGPVDLAVEDRGVALVLGGVGDAGIPHDRVEEVAGESHPLEKVGLVVRARALRPLADGDGAGAVEGRVLVVRDEGHVLVADQGLEGRGGLEGDKVVGPDEVGDLVGDEHVLVDGDLGRDGEGVGVAVGELLEGLLHPSVQHLLPGFKPPANMYYY